MVVPRVKETGEGQLQPIRKSFTEKKKKKNLVLNNVYGKTTFLK